MAVYERYYTLTIPASVVIEAKSEKEAEEIFENLESGEKCWYYLKNEVFDSMGEYLANNEREVVFDIKPDGLEESCWADEGIDYERYL